MGDTDKSPSLTRLLGVSTPLLLAPAFFPPKPRHHDIFTLPELRRTFTPFTIERVDDRNAWQQWVANSPTSAMRGIP